jgi:hypothetical protein
MDNWPFPPPGGPIPWTAEQERAYQREQRKQTQQEQDEMEEAPW